MTTTTTTTTTTAVRKKPLVVCLQETKLNSKSKAPVFQNYTLIRQDRPVRTGGGGLAFLVRQSVPFTSLDTARLNDGKTEVQALTITINKVPTQIFNIYIPPASSCPRYRPKDNFREILRSTSGNCIICGDLNAHDASWYSSMSDVRGEALAEVIDDTSLVILNTDSPTRIRGNCKTSPDVTLASANLAAGVSWSADVHLNSDHIPISVCLLEDTKDRNLPKRTFTNYRKADWGSFKRECEAVFENLPLPTSCSKGEKVFRNVLLTSSRHNIPSGRVNNFVPGLSAEAAALARKRDNLRIDDPTSPDIAVLSARISSISSDESRREWLEKLEHADHNTDIREFWDILGRLKGTKSQPPPNQPIQFGDKVLTDHSKIANGFTKQYTSIGRHKHNPRAKRTNRKLRKRHRRDVGFSPFTVDMVVDAIKAAKNSSAEGPDGLCALHLKNLGPKGLTYLTALYNLSVRDSEIPAIWKTAVIVPLVKPGKPADNSKSYRPISLLSPCIKTLEKLILPDLSEAVPNPDFQHGYRAGRSTITALIPLVTLICNGFCEKKPAIRTGTVTIDISKAFDAVSHEILLKKLTQIPLNSNLTRWLACWLKGRQAYAVYRETKGKHRICHVGVPQGSVLSPVLFNFFVSDFPMSTQLTTNYADDFSISETAVEPAELGRLLTAAFIPISKWAKKNSLSIEPTKCHVTLFTPWMEQMKAKPKVFINGRLVDLERNPKFLGVTFNWNMSSTPHAQDVIKRVTRRIQILKAVAGSSWGFEKETLLLTYRALILSIISYACPIWYPNICKTELDKLQRLQNQALRICTGNHSIASLQHIHSESKILPVADHLDMLCKQFLITASQPDHAAFRTVNIPNNTRMRSLAKTGKTLSHKFGPQVSHLLTNGVMEPARLKPSLNQIHSASVSAAIVDLGPHPILGITPPPIHYSERSLHRHWRSTLSQLRAGFSVCLNTYLNRIGRAPFGTCGECLFQRHTSSHLFKCPAVPTSMTFRDLWDRPCDVAMFLQSLSAFSHLPRLGPPPPLPPPEPPP